MKKNIIFLALLIMSSLAHAQKILSRTSTIAKLGENKINLVENMSGTSYYDLILSSSEIQKVGTKIVNTNKETIIISFDNKESLIKCLTFLYNFDKGEGYFIDLENKTKNTAMSVKNGFIFGSQYDFEKPTINQWTFGKLLNKMGVSVQNNKDGRNKKYDDVYTNPKALF